MKEKVSLRAQGSPVLRFRNRVNYGVMTACVLRRKRQIST